MCATYAVIPPALSVIKRLGFSLSFYYYGWVPCHVPNNFTLNNFTYAKALFWQATQQSHYGKGERQCFVDVSKADLLLATHMH